MSIKLLLFLISMSLNVFLVWYIFSSAARGRKLEEQEPEIQDIEINFTKEDQAELESLTAAGKAKELSQEAMDRLSSIYDSLVKEELKKQKKMFR